MLVGNLDLLESVDFFLSSISSMVGSRCPRYSPLLNMMCLYNLILKYWCFAFDVVNAIYNIYMSFPFVESGLLMSCDCVTFDLGGYDAIMSRRYFESWFNISYCCLLFTVCSVCEKSAILLYVAILFLSQAYDSENFFCISVANIISVSGGLSHIIKLWVSLKSTILR